MRPTLLRLLPVLAAALMLSACSDLGLNDLLSFSDEEVADVPAQAAPAVVAPRPVAANAPDPFCLAVAGQDLKEGVFDQSTQQKMALRGYKQCMGIFRAD